MPSPPVSAGAEPTALWLSDYGGSYGGSAVSMVSALSRGLSARGWRFECGYTSVAAGRDWLDDLAAANIPADIAPDGRAAKARWLGEKLDRIAGPAVLHTHFASFDIAAVAAARQRPDVAVVWHVHSFLRREPSHAARAFVKYGWIGRRVDRVICVSDAAARSVHERGASRSRTVVIPNGLDADRFPVADDATRRQAKDLVGVPHDRPMMLHFGWDWEVKGGDLFAEAVREVRARGVDAIGVVVDGGEETHAAAERLGLGDALVAAAPTEDVLRFFNAADVLVASSPAEGGGPPMAMIEALSCGTPVVATDIPGHRIQGAAPGGVEMVAADPRAIAEAVKSTVLLTDAEKAARAAESHDWVDRERGMMRWVDRVADTYAEVLQAR